MKTPFEQIQDVEEGIARSLEQIKSLPFNETVSAGLRYFDWPGFRIAVQLEEAGRKKRSTASSSNWTPETGEIVISFERIEREDAVTPEAQPTSAAETAVADARVGSSAGAGDDAARECCEALADAEKAGKAFVALKWFRDDYLPTRDYGWVRSAESRERVLGRAIERGWIQTNRIPNPKNPQFPTTTVHLRRTEQAGVKSRFNPIKIQGEPLSVTILKDRGAY